jgi:hypothetical protein
MVYMNAKHEKMGLYTALDDDGQQILRQKKSRWS